MTLRQLRPLITVLLFGGLALINFWQIQRINTLEHNIHHFKQSLNNQSMTQAIHAAAAAQTFNHSQGEQHFWLHIAQAYLTASSPAACRTALSNILSDTFSTSQRTQFIQALKQLNISTQSTVEKPPQPSFKGFSFKNLLKTNHGERLGSYTFGANLEELAFEVASDEIEQEAINRINSAISKFMPFVTLNNFEAFTEHFDNSHVAKIGIRVTYAIPNLGVANEQLEVILKVAG